MLVCFFCAWEIDETMPDLAPADMRAVARQMPPGAAMLAPPVQQMMFMQAAAVEHSRCLDGVIGMHLQLAHEPIWPLFLRLVRSPAHTSGVQ